MKIETSYSQKPWTVHYGKGVPESIDFKELTMPAILKETAAKYPSTTALLYEGTKVSYSQLDEMVNRCASFLHDLGVKKGERIGIMLPNSVPLVVSYYAILRIGAVAVMNNPLFTDRELEFLFKDSGISVLITLDRLCERMLRLRKKTEIRHIVCSSIGDFLPIVKKAVFGVTTLRNMLPVSVKRAENMHNWKQSIMKYAPSAPDISVTLDDEAMMQYTGGTTGITKGVVLTHRNISFQVQQIAAWFPDLIDGNERLLGALPFYYVFGISTAMNFSVLKGFTDIILPNPHPEPLYNAIKRFKPTFVPLVPTMYIGLLHQPGLSAADLSSIKGCFSGSAPLPLHVITEFQEKTGALICEGFGMTEASPVTHINPYVEGKTIPGSIGVPISNTECRVVSVEDRKTDLPVGEAGELVIRGPQVVRGYLNNPDETAETLRDGWLHTGDIATMDKNGYFYIVGRMKDMIITSGFNVFPRDVDEVFFQHPKIKEACAIGIPHPVKGEAIKIFIVLREGEKATPEEMISFCDDKLVYYKIPEEVEFREHLPKSSIGKVLRNELKAQEMMKREGLQSAQ
ncbi:MAG TPA: long-chain fatty acid--CoA ligase [Spirochaetota bacterium]|nr:long-chain fatty acid--CoA ligase [Spirochaetota bacterium]